MRKFKLVLGLIILAFLGLFFYQNKLFFMEKPALSLQLPFMQMAHLPELPNAILFLACILFGLLISYFFNLLERFKAGKIIKNLNATVDSNLEMISALKNEMAAIKNSDTAPGAKADEVQEGIEQKV